MWTNPGLAVLGVLFASVYAALMVDRRQRGLELPNQLLILSMALVGAGGIGIWALWLNETISAGGMLVVVSAWLANAAASGNERINPGVIFFALCQTAAVGSLEVDTQEPTPLWVAVIVAGMWATVGYGVRTHKGSPGWLCLALMAAVAMLVSVQRM